MLNLPPLNGEQTNLLLPDLRTLEAGLTSTDGDSLAAYFLILYLINLDYTPPKGVQLES